MERQKLQEVLSSPYTVFLYGEVNGELAKQIVQQIAEFCRQWIENGIPESEREIVVRINSPGGSVVDGYAILDNLKATGFRIITVAEGMAASMGAFLLSVAGTKGARLAFQNAEILIHQPLGGAQGQATELEIVVARMQKVKRRLNYLMSEATGKSVQEIEAATDRDHFLTAEEALAFGLIDQIIE